MDFAPNKDDAMKVSSAETENDISLLDHKLFMECIQLQTEHPQTR